ncbi:MAG TPA: ABC transporter ATP-binding protein [Candidatus Acidoferrales bacterium]|nr:ABC transporter ATP-binding protein [Candidatus Acidoferrales bacterium]
MRDVLFDCVSVRFGGTVALDRVGFACRAGRVTCLVGPNGAGKSTALATAAGIVRSHAGAIVIGKQRVKPYAPMAGRSYLPQNGAFPKLLVVREVLDFAAALTGASHTQYETALDVTGVREVFERRIGELSGGWERRVALAWALLQPADILLLDEPLVGLDPETLDRIVAHLAKRAARGDTVAMATHDFEAVAPLRPAVVVLAEGRLIEQFNDEEVALRAAYRAALTGETARCADV